MHRIAWITAAGLIDKHRDYAFLVLLQRLHELEQEPRTWRVECGVGVVV